MRARFSHSIWRMGAGLRSPAALAETSVSLLAPISILLILGDFKQVRRKQKERFAKAKKRKEKNPCAYFFLFFFVTCHPCTARALISLHNACMLCKVWQRASPNVLQLKYETCLYVNISTWIKYLVLMSHRKNLPKSPSFSHSAWFPVWLIYFKIWIMFLMSVDASKTAPLLFYPERGSYPLPPSSLLPLPAGPLLRPSSLRSLRVSLLFNFCLPSPDRAGAVF